MPHHLSSHLDLNLAITITIYSVARRKQWQAMQEYNVQGTQEEESLCC